MRLNHPLSSPIHGPVHGLFTDMLRYPDGAILYYDANTDAYTEQTYGPHTFNSSILAPQYQRNADGSYSDVGTGPAVDVFGGEKWLRSCGAITNLFSGDTSVARSVTLTAQAYTLQVFGEGTVSCSYGTATAGDPLIFTAVAGATTFTPSDATYWMLTATAYPVPYVPPGVTQPASNATATNGCWFTLADGSPVWNALSGEPLTLATRVRMGVGSADVVSAGGIVNCMASASMDVQYINAVSVVKSNCGPTAAAIAVSFPRSTIIRRVTQVNTAGTQFRVGYMIEGTHTTIQWSPWEAYDGSFNPSTLYRLMLGYNNKYPMGYNKIAAWNKQMDDEAILEALS